MWGQKLLGYRGHHPFVFVVNAVAHPSPEAHSEARLQDYD